MANGIGDRRIASRTENPVVPAAGGRFLDFIPSTTYQFPCNWFSAEVILIQEIFATKRGTNDFRYWTRSRCCATESFSRGKLL
jgi:hypothetical protein